MTNILRAEVGRVGDTGATILLLHAEVWRVRDAGGVGGVTIISRGSGGVGGLLLFLLLFWVRVWEGWGSSQLRGVP